MSARRCLPFLFVPLLLLLAACADAQEAVDETPAASPTAQPSETPTAAPPVEDTPTPAPSGIGPLPSPEPGFKWADVAPKTEAGLPGYAVQIPQDWETPGLLANPVQFAATGATAEGPQLLTMVTPVDTGFEHPTLFNLPQMGTTCGEGVPRGQMPGSPPDAPDATPAAQFSEGDFIWSVFLFSCTTRLTAVDVAEGKEPAPFDVRAAETQVGQFIFSVTVLEPASSGAGQVAFEEAMRSFTLR